MIGSGPATRVPLLMEPAFLDRPTCQRIRAGMDAGLDEPAEIAGDRITARRAIRRTRSIEIESALLAAVEQPLDRIRPHIEHVLRRQLGHREGTGFLRYPSGGFYRPHRDRADVPGWPAAAWRAVSVVVFLNDGANGDEPAFDGGLLCLYPDRLTPIRIEPRTGLLVAFPADVVHEVRPVGGGPRDAAVDWFYDANAPSGSLAWP